jgi:hypothetical protein
MWQFSTMSCKINNYNGWWKSKILKIKISPWCHASNFDGLTKKTSLWYYHCSCKLVAIESHNSCSYIIVIELHMYTISHIVNCICWNSCNLSNNMHAHRNTLSCNELQMVIAIQKPSCKVTCKLPHFFIMKELSSSTPTFKVVNFKLFQIFMLRFGD